MYTWYEEDGGSTTTTNISFATTFTNSNGTTSTVNATTEVTIKDDDDFLGDTIVEYCDNTDGDGYTYTLPFFVFQVRQLK